MPVYVYMPEYVFLLSMSASLCVHIPKQHQNPSISSDLPLFAEVWELAETVGAMMMSREILIQREQWQVVSESPDSSIGTSVLLQREHNGNSR